MLPDLDVICRNSGEALYRLVDRGDVPSNLEQYENHCQVSLSLVSPLPPFFFLFLFFVFLNDYDHNGCYDNYKSVE